MSYFASDFFTDVTTSKNSEILGILHSDEIVGAYEIPLVTSILEKNLPLLEKLQQMFQCLDQTHHNVLDLFIFINYEQFKHI